MESKADRQLATSTAGADRTEMSVADMGSGSGLIFDRMKAWIFPSYNLIATIHVILSGVDFERLPSRDQNRRSKMNHELS